jgi:hypothetical protein
MVRSAQGIDDSRRTELERSLNILLLCDYQEHIAATVRDHIRSLETHSRHKWRRLSMLGDIPAGLDLSRFDAVVVHYTLVACSDFYLTPAARQRLTDFKGLKAIFIQDEYRFVDKSTAAMREIGVNVLFTCAPPAVMTKVYPPKKLPGVTVVNCLTGYVPAELLDRPVTAPAERPIDIGYRGRNVPAWLGELGQEKIRIGIRVRDEAPAQGLKADISFREEDRLYGEAWIDFVSRCKAMLGVESGASVVDFTGEIQRRVEAHVAKKPHTPFAELRDLYFAKEEGKISFAQISPRCFESAALRTLMVLYEGSYSGVLEPWRHYVPLKKNHSNFDEVARILRDPTRIEEIVTCAYNEIARNPRWSFQQATKDVDDVLDGAFRPEMRSNGAAYSDREYRSQTADGISTLRRRAQRRILTGAYKFLFGFVLSGLDPVTRTRVQGTLRKVYNAITFYRLRRRDL